MDLGLFGCYSCYGKIFSRFLKCLIGQFVSLFMLPSKFLKVQEIHGFKVIVFAVCPRSGKFLSICIEEPRRSIKKSHFENLDMNDGYNTSLLYKVLEISSITGFFLNKGSFLHFLDNIVSGLENDLYDLHNVVIKEMVLNSFY